MDTKKRKKICLYVDQKSEQGRKVIEDLDNAGIRYATVPVSSSIPRASFGRARFVGADEISRLIERAAVQRTIGGIEQEQQETNMRLNFYNLPAGHETSIHIFLDDALPLLDTLYRAGTLDAMTTKICAPLTRCTVRANGIVKMPTRMQIKFSECGCCGQAVKALWTALHGQNLKVTWKHGNTGHTIGPNLEILDSWKLDDGMC